MPISTAVFKSNTEGTNAIRTVRHSEAPQRRKFYMAGGGFRTLAGQGSSPATQRRQTWRVFRFRSEDTADCGEDFVRPTIRRLNRGEVGAEHRREMTTRIRNSAYALYLMATVGSGGYRPRIDNTELESTRLDSKSPANTG